MFTLTIHTLRWTKTDWKTTNLTNHICWLFFSHTDSLEREDSKWLPAVVRANYSPLSSQKPCSGARLSTTLWTCLLSWGGKWERGRYSFVFGIVKLVSLTCDGRDERCATGSGDPAEEEGWFADNRKVLAAKGQRHRRSSGHSSEWRDFRVFSARPSTLHKEAANSAGPVLGLNSDS